MRVVEEQGRCTATLAKEIAERQASELRGIKHFERELPPRLANTEHDF